MDFIDEELAPDATTLCKLRKVHNDNGVMKLLIDTIDRFMEKQGRIMHGGTIIDATIIEALTSAKNAEQLRDFERHQVKRGNEWHFGEQFYIGVDAGTELVYSLEIITANQNERNIVPYLIRLDDEVVYGDAGHSGMEKRPEIENNVHPCNIDYRTNTHNRPHWKKQAPGFDWDKQIKYQKSRVRSKVEYVSLIIKQPFHYRKVRYRGLMKNRTHAFILATCANLFMLAQFGWRMGVCDA